MDPTTEKDNSPEAIRERVVSKQQEFEGGSDPGWQRMEAAVDDTRHQAAQTWSGESDATSQQPSGEASVSGYGSAQSFSGGSSDIQGANPSQSSSQAASSGGSDTAAGGTSGATSARDAEVADIPSSPEHPVGVGQQCFHCGAYNDVDAENCWNCSEPLTHSVTETPGIVESIETATSAESSTMAESDDDTTIVANADANTDVTAESDVTDYTNVTDDSDTYTGGDTTTESDVSRGARPLSSD